MYLLGIVVAIVASIIMKIFSKNYEVPPFIMELPAYHAPQFRNLMAHLWEKFKHFIYKASTIITASIVLIWFLSSYGWEFWEGMVEIEDSMLADVGRVFAYFFYPLGWSQGADGWKFSVASVTGLIAKEDVVTTMAQLGLCDEAGETILFNMTNSKIFAFAAYNLFTFPCFAAIATAKSESSKKAFPVTLLFWFFGSYVISLIVYLVGLLFEVHLLLGLLVLGIIGCSIVLTGYLVSKRNQKKILA
jgi:ferrous iron transport protein B